MTKYVPQTVSVAETQKPQCCCDTLIINGETYIGVEPDCPIHGFEAHVRQHAPYYAEQSDGEVEQRSQR